MSYQEDAATEVACRLLARVRYMTRLKLMKLMYIIDQAALLRWGYSVTGDWYIAMAHGPVLSQTYENIRQQCEETAPIWTSHIDSSCERAIRLKAICDFAVLSKAEIGLVEEVISEYGNKSAIWLRNHTHKFPEWSNPSPNRAKSITIHDILVKNGVPEDEALITIEGIEAFSMMDQAFS